MQKRFQNSVKYVEKLITWRKTAFLERKRMTAKEKNCKIAFLSTDETEGWIVDSAATSHMTNDSSVLKEGQKISTKVGVASKEGSMIAKKTGTIDLGNCKLNDVLYIPDLRRNLLSVSRITEKGGKVEFFEDKVKVK